MFGAASLLGPLFGALDRADQAEAAHVGDERCSPSAQRGEKRGPTSSRTHRRGRADEARLRDRRTECPRCRGQYASSRRSTRPRPCRHPPCKGLQCRPTACQRGNLDDGGRSSAATSSPEPQSRTGLAGHAPMQIDRPHPCQLAPNRAASHRRVSATTLVRPAVGGAPLHGAADRFFPSHWLSLPGRTCHQGHSRASA